MDVDDRFQPLPKKTPTFCYQGFQIFTNFTVAERPGNDITQHKTVNNEQT